METVTYVKNFVENPDEAFRLLQSELAWVRRDGTPRSEYYFNKANVPYTYGRGRGVREYQPQPAHPLIDSLIEKLAPYTAFEVCFLNRYHNQSDQLGWHSDNSPEMDDARPIAIISLGAEREIWFRTIPSDLDIGDPSRSIPLPSGDILPIAFAPPITKLKLEHGSLCLMAPGMQDTHEHRIPKAGFECGERISLTFRGYNG